MVHTACKHILEQLSLLEIYYNAEPVADPEAEVSAKRQGLSRIHPVRV